MEQLNNILQLPENCLLNKKITKAFFKRNFPLTLTERKLLDDANCILQMELVASIKHQNSNIPLYKDAEYIFEEIEIITVQLGEELSEKNTSKVIDLIQKYIPYPILLVVYNATQYLFNTTSKRINLNDTDKRTIESSLTTNVISNNTVISNEERNLHTLNVISTKEKSHQLFLQQMAFEKLDKQNLKTCYQSFESNIASLQAVEFTGSFKPRQIERAKADVEKMTEIKSLENEILLLRSKAAKEAQLNIQVEINNRVLTIQRKLNSLKILINDI